MGSNMLLQLPIIDFSKLDEPGSSKWESTKSEVIQAAKDCGCFEILLDVPIELRNAVFAVAEHMFDLPLETKKLNISEKPFHGYASHPGLVPPFETLGVEDADDAINIENFINTFWPQGNTYYSKALETFTKHVSQIDSTVRTMILESLGLEKHSDEHFGSTSHLLKFQKYNKLLDTAEPQHVLEPHTDKDTTTILHQINQVEGLEVQTQDGRWVRVKPSPNSFIFMIGEAFKAWTNGRVRPAVHRVIMKGNDARYSIGLFAMPKGGYIIKAPDELVDKEHPLLFKPFDNMEFLKFFQSHQGLPEVEDAMNAYCGVKYMNEDQP